MFLWTFNAKALHECMENFHMGSYDGDYCKPDVVTEKFNQFFQPKRNFIFERNWCWPVSLKPGVSFEKILADVRTQGKKCEFENITPDQCLHVKLILLTLDGLLKKTLLKNSDLALEKLIKETGSYYGAKSHLVECDGTAKRADEHVN